jgi:RNA-directed DNA polymerase
VADNKKDWYIQHRIPKRSGGIRVLEEPVEWLKEVQTQIYNEVLLPNFKLSQFAYGGVKGRNIAHAALVHVKSKIKLKMDIDNFFPSVTSDMVKVALSSNKNMTEDDINNIANLCTNADGVLPQGGVTSMALANIVSAKMHNVIGRIADRMDLKFTIYVDDLIISGDAPGRMVPIIKKVCSRYGFAIKDAKTVTMRNKQEILGLCATPAMDHPRLPRKVRNSLRGKLHRIIMDLENGTKVDMAFVRSTLGMAAFANMAMDQKAPTFAAKTMRINQMLKGHKGTNET